MADFFGSGKKNQKVVFFCEKEKECPRAQEESTKQRFDRVAECDSKPRIIIDQAKSQLYATSGSGYQSRRLRRPGPVN